MSSKETYETLKRWHTVLCESERSKKLLDDLGVEGPRDLLLLDRSDVIKLAACLKKVPGRRFERELKEAGEIGTIGVTTEAETAEFSQRLDDSIKELDAPHPLITGGPIANQFGSPVTVGDVGSAPPPPTETNGYDTPLHEAARKGDREGVVKELERGADVNAVGEDGWGPVHSAAAGGIPQVMEWMMAKGDIDLNAAVPHTKVTPLTIASEAGHKEMVKWLVGKGVELEARDLDGWTALLSGSQNGHVAVVEILLSAKADVNATSAEGQSCLALACQNGHMRLAKYFVQAGVDPNYATDGGKTPLLSAAAEGQHEVVEWLVKKAGADKNQAGGDGISPLRCARMQGQSDVVRILHRLDAKDSGAARVVRSRL